MKFLFFSFLIVINSNFSYGAKKESPQNYVKATKSYQIGLYEDSVKFYKEYLAKCKKEKCETKRVLFALDILGTIYIRHRHDPKSLLTYLEAHKKNKLFNDAVEDEIADWIGAANDYITVKLHPKKINNADKLYSLGKNYFDKGQKMKAYPMDRKGNPQLSIASGYLLEYIYKHDSANKIDEALYMMGVIRSTLWYERDFWTQNHYLKEAIRRFPGTKMAKKAYSTLEAELKHSYTGSAGDFTPESQISLLKYFKDIAYGEVKKVETKVNTLN